MSAPTLCPICGFAVLCADGEPCLLEGNHILPWCDQCILRGAGEAPAFGTV